MLQSLRSGAGSWVIKILLFLLIASFAVWGIGDVFRNRGLSDPVATVGGEEITPLALDNQFRTEIQQFSAYFGQLTAAQARELGLLDRALERLVTQTLVQLAAKEADLRVSDELVRRKIMSEPAFQNDQGRFDRNRFTRALLSANMTEASFVEALRRDTARTLLLDAVAAGATAPRSLVEALYRTRAETRTADVVRIPLDGIEVPEPDEATLRAHYEANQDAYMAPELRRLTILALTPDTLAGTIEVTDDDLRAAYDAAIDSFRTPERRSVVQAVAPTREAAEALVAAAADQPLAQAAAANPSVQVSDLGEVARGELVLPELEQAAFTLDVGGLSAPVETPLGWIVLQVTGVTPASVRPIEEVRAELEASIRQEAAEDRIFDLSNALTDTLAGGATIEEAAAEHGLQARELPPVSAEGRTVDGVEQAEIAALPALLNEAFRLSDGEDTGLIETANGGFAIARVDEVVPAAPRPFEDVREDVAASWRTAQRTESAQARARAIAERLTAGDAADAVATEVGATATRVGPVARDAKDQPEALLRTLFTTPAGQVATVELEDAYVALRVADVTPGDPAAGGQALQDLAASVENSIANDIRIQYIQSLREIYPVEVNPAVIRRMYATDAP